MKMKAADPDDVQELWLDQLCIESIIRIIRVKGFAPKVVYYCQISVLVKPFLKIISLLSRATYSQIIDIELGALRMEGVSLFELIHTRINLFLEKYAEGWLQRSDIHSVVHKQSYNPDKVNAYLIGEGFFLVYRPIGLICIAQKLSRITPTVILTKNFFANSLSREYGQVSLIFYHTYISHYFTFLNRLCFKFDEVISGKYSCDRFFSYKNIVKRWLTDFAVIIATQFLCLNRATRKNTHASNIVVEFTQRMFRPDENNDLFWLPSSQIAGDTVYHLETSVLDKKSQQNLSEYGVHRLRIGGKRTTLEGITGKYRGNDVPIVTPGFKYIIQGLFGLLKFPKYFLGSAESSWIHLCLLKYEMEASYWQSIYHQYNIRILWSMSDGGIPHLAKSQAVENLGGFYTGSHWSNFPTCQIYNKKYYDVYFVWANHFLKNILTHYSYPATFVSGYVSDHYFEKHRERANKLRNKFPGKFIITYNDNKIMKEGSLSANMLLNLHKMFIDILEKNDQVVLFLKPKGKSEFDGIKSQLSKLGDWIEQDRIVLFFGEGPSRKTVPALVGMASDLVVSLGISTTSVECHFAGTLAFHADLGGMVNNDFGNRGLGKIVFRDIDTLKKAIQNCIEEGTSQRYQEAVEINAMLDPFQDGMAYRRVGSVLKRLQGALEQGESREQALQTIKQYYQELVPFNLNCSKQSGIYHKAAL